MNNFQQFYNLMTMNNLSTTVSYPTLDDFDTTLLEFSTENSSELYEEYEGSEHPYGLRYGIWTTIALSIAYTLISAIGIVGNLAVYIVVTRSPQMRTLTNQFIANLALADLLVNTVCVPTTLISNLYPGRCYLGWWCSSPSNTDYFEHNITREPLLSQLRAYARFDAIRLRLLIGKTFKDWCSSEWTLGSFFCKTVSYMQGVSVSASVNTLMAISIERCVAISCPYFSITSRQYRLAVTVIWLIALTINLPWLFVFRLQPIKIGSSRNVCIELWPSTLSANLFFILANLVLCYLGPLCVISFCYIIIWRSVANRNIPGEYLGNKSTLDAIRKSRLKVTKMVFVVIITFAVSWLPLYAIFCVVKFREDLLLNEQIRDVIFFLVPMAQWLGASNSCINPILYCYMNKKFRVSFMSLITGCSLRFQDDIAMNQVRSDSYYRVYKFTAGRSMPSRKSEAGPSVSKV